MFKDLDWKEASQYIKLPMKMNKRKLKNIEEEGKVLSNSIENEENCRDLDPPTLTDTEDTDDEFEFYDGDDDDDVESGYDDINAIMDSYEEKQSFNCISKSYDSPLDELSKLLQKKKNHENPETPTLTKYDDHTENIEIMGSIEGKQDGVTLTELCQTVFKATHQGVIKIPSGVKYAILDGHQLSALRELNNNKDNQNPPALCESVISPSEHKSKLLDDQNGGFVRTNRWFMGKKPIGLIGGAEGKKSQQINMGLRLINNSN